MLSILSAIPPIQYYYVDQEYNIGHGWYGFYTVTAIDETVESEFSNTATTKIDAFNKDGNMTSKSDATLSFSLSQNHPNPFNPTTTIKYIMQESGDVKLVVTNSLGEEVKIIDEGFKEAGEYSKIFNSENLPSGIYICSLIT